MKLFILLLVTGNFGAEYFWNIILQYKKGLKTSALEVSKPYQYSVWRLFDQIVVF